MAETILYTAAPALQTAHVETTPPTGSAVHEAFSQMLDCLAHLLRVEEGFASGWSFDPAFVLELDETTHAYAAVGAAALAVLAAPVSTVPALVQGDRALQRGALLVRAVIGMEAPLDSAALCQLLARHRGCLLEPGQDAASRAVNRLLGRALRRLAALAALMEAPADMAPEADIATDQQVMPADAPATPETRSLAEILALC